MGSSYSSSPVVQASDNSGFRTNTINSTGCDILFVILSANQDNPSVDTSPSDNKGNTYTQVGKTYSDLGGVVSLWYTRGTFGASHTITTGGSFGSQIVEGWSGSHASPGDQVNGAYNGGTNSLGTGSITPSTDGCLILAVEGTRSTGTPSIGAGFTADPGTCGRTPGTSIGVGAGYAVQGPAASVSATWTTADSDALGVIIASFKPASYSAGGGVTWQKLIQDNQPLPDTRVSVAA